MRYSEQYNLQWEDVDLARRKITLQKTKAGKRQIVRLNASAIAALEGLGPKKTGSLCDDDEWAFRTWWDEVCEAAKVSDFHWHDLRHTFASRLVMAGVHIYTVSKLRRHGSVPMTERYAHLARTHLDSAVERLDEGVTGGITAVRETTPSASRAIH
jgi:integrase